MKQVDKASQQSDEFYKEVEKVYLRVSKAIAVFLGLLGLALIGYQSWLYFDTSHWQSISIISLLSYFDLDWADSPERLLILHQILDFIPLSLCFFGLALAQYLSGFIFIKKLKKLLQVSM